MRLQDRLRGSGTGCGHRSRSWRCVKLPTSELSCGFRTADSVLREFSPSIAGMRVCDRKRKLFWRLPRIQLEKTRSLVTPVPSPSKERGLTLQAPGDLPGSLPYRGSPTEGRGVRLVSKSVPTRTCKSFSIARTGRYQSQSCGAVGRSVSFSPMLLK